MKKFFFSFESEAFASDECVTGTVDVFAVFVVVVVAFVVVVVADSCSGQQSRKKEKKAPTLSAEERDKRWSVGSNPGTDTPPPPQFLELMF